jgi:5'-nucleotidase (lipoprotein e(P4) family)
MKNMSVFLFVVFLSACIKQQQTEFSNNNLYSTLWMQTAAEYIANSVMTYQAAAALLPELISDKNNSALLEQKEGFQELPPAIILDVDETVLDNSPYEGKLIMENKEFASDTWNYWLSLKQAKAIPGVVDFLNKAQDMGVTIFYVTNRRCTPLDNEPCPQDQQTFENLQNVGINNVSRENVLLRDEQQDWDRDKTSRREYVAEKYRVIMLFGDNLADFLADTAKTQQERAELINQNMQRWGNSWFMLANPSYGGWQSVLKNPLESNIATY